ncbi:2-succinyl-5-enolpyruvyl-6-hydroxy-3-cyclohexene-1-carboxylic-acid synthase [Lentibacillus salicampi]|uniref:2-succinyl-5-enolpyruvyl-6-hydroxy-3-cyclohexene-1-carboxylate synthase n=1 Tax=Lentibacillus salicampi TaxID=175306 RepID=A0A4Y9AAC3_9BACI|nr:2-succinyl-5-enolpyruvyl-6-hydroxy-3-cyclohexene-1-carboxylic-acid synthase [Lentibacillus salicampi]TFJ92806.1 2-succinyl-5-enolpyruvyl-6-hydroxy-3-cyclohexene-1-carboxylic-acid synthase [Lentibacillus salicampi]
MNHTEELTRYTANFVDELAANGLTDVVISPGSRSTPLAMTIAEHPELEHWVVIDERSAAFFALGMAKKKQHAVALVCSSGTAAANYYPAMIEAFYSRVPLVVLTADRPHELRDTGAPQAIDQIRLYGDYAKWFHDMALPQVEGSMLTYARGKASRAVNTAKENNPGPVHLNFPFREPLIPDFSLENVWGARGEKPFYANVDGKRRLRQEQLETLKSTWQSFQRGLIVCGPQTDRAFAAAVTELAAAWQVPILADPLSQIRAGGHSKDVVIESYDTILRSESIRKQLQPDFIIRFGAMPVSKPYLFYVKEHGDIPQFVVENAAGYREPAGNKTEMIYADATWLCRDLASMTDEAFDADWLQTWQQMNQTAKGHLLEPDNTDAVTEGEAVRCLLDVIPDKSSIYVGNSMAVRDLDTFFMSTPKSVEVLANRGANGIDGMVSSGMGAAAASGAVTLLLGDLSFFHDMNGLLAAKHHGLNITILVVNNNGGGIFSFLPQAGHEAHFEALFGTPLDIAFEQVADLYGGTYRQPLGEAALKQALDESYHDHGLSIIEVKTDRTANLEWHRDKWQQIEDALRSDKE